jgi:lipopolysaccharide transport system ATP-binding protein
MSDSAIVVENLSKSYLIGHRTGADGKYKYTALRDVIGREICSFARKAADLARGRQIVQGDEIEKFWALKNVSFEVKRGEVVGIIGRNGAGKSTLLKILSRITEPTKGRVLLWGRVASLLEVGTGFHPELTGRENIYLNGAILGMIQSEIRRKFDEIVAFAEVERFLDTPVKHYSSGMYVRLAFAVAAHLESEILIVDEVLAVGDTVFQEKCLGRMRNVANSGRTVLFVSHNLSSLMQLTSRSIVLSQGRMVMSGETAKAVEFYAASVSSGQSTKFDVENTPRRYQGTGDARILSLRFDRPVAHFGFQELLSYSMRLRAARSVDRLRVSMTIFSITGVPIGSAFGKEISGFDAGEVRELMVNLADIRLAPGSYYCAVAIGRGNNQASFVDYDIVQDTLYFEVMPESTSTGALVTWTNGWGFVPFPEMAIEWKS